MHPYKQPGNGLYVFPDIKYKYIFTYVSSIKIDVALYINI